MSPLHALLATLAFIVLHEAVDVAVTFGVIAFDPPVNKFWIALQRCISKLLFLATIIAWLRVRGGAAAVVPSRTRARYYIAAVLLGIGFVLVHGPVHWIYAQLSAVFHPSASPEPIPVVSGVDLSGMLTLATVSSVVIAPIIEELFFRSGIQRGLERSTSHVIAVMYSALLFSTIHLPYWWLFFDEYGGSGQHAFVTFFGGFISAVLFSRSRSVGPSIVFHAAWNATVAVSY